MSKAKAKPRNILKSVTCFNKIFWLFGLGFSKAETGKAQVNLCNRMRFLLNLSCSLFAMVIVLSEEAVIVNNGSMIVTSAWHYQYQLQGVLMLPLMIFNYVKQEHVRELLRKLQEFDESIEESEWMMCKPKRHRFRLEMGVVIVSMAFLLAFVIFVLGHYLDFDLASIKSVRTCVFFFMTEFYILISFQFTFGALNIYRRFRVLNANIG
jgi:hypothetical protein